MSISWQTGEPPCGVALVIEYKFRGWPQAYKRIGMKLPSGNWRLDGHSGEQNDVEVLRWSTLDDDRSAKAMGALEKYLVTKWLDQVHIGVGKEGEGFAFYNVDEQRGAEAPSLIEAIEKLTKVGTEPKQPRTTKGK